MLLTAKNVHLIVCDACLNTKTHMQGGIFQLACSLAVVLRGGECKTGAGGDGGARGILLFILWRGGSIGSF